MDDRAPAAGKTYLAACMTYRDHSFYLREWIEFHRLVGIEKFFLYDNGSSDDHLAVLAPYVEEGSVVVHDWPGTARQLAAFDHCLETHREEARWIAFLDVDEFLFSPEGRPVPEILREFEQWPGVGVNLVLFGTSGHVSRPDGLVIENYLTRGGGKGAKWIKSIVDPRRALHCAGGHHFVYESGQAVDVCKRPIEDWCTESYLDSPLRINHYFTKSLEELKEKIATPRADTGELRAPIDFDKLPRAEARYVRDETILMYLPRLKAALRQISTSRR
jgi:hypothetical protein